mgnify:CR=1 FL=1
MDDHNATSHEQPRCAAATKSGQPCRGRPLPGRPFCLSHDPSLAAERDAARQKGGRNRAAAARLGKLLPARLAPTFEKLEAALGEVHDGALDPKVAGAMAAIARAMVAVLQAGELEQRVRELEARAAGAGG